MSRTLRLQKSQRANADRSAGLLRTAAALLPIVILLATWQLLAALELWPPQVFVPPATVAQQIVRMANSGELAEHLGASLYRLGSGFLVGATVGLVLGCVMALSRLADRLAGPLFHGLRQVPVIAFIPLLILFFDVEDNFKIVVVAAAAFFPVALATYDGISGIPKSHLEVARLYRLPPAALIRLVIVPATVPPIVTGLRLGLTRAWLSLVAAELLAADSGLGQMMETGRQMFRIDTVMAAVLITGVIGFLIDRSMIALENRLGRWRTA
jgi:sulfonate transport system permease protein